MTASDQDFLKLENISKDYGGVHALSNVDFSCKKGSIHAILGENGAGKSTLIKIMAGVVWPSDGKIIRDGKPVKFRTPKEAVNAGIVCMFQELSLIPDLTVAENLSLAEPAKRFGLIDKQAELKNAKALLARIHCEDIDPTAKLRELSLSRRQMVEIAKALGRNPEILILDEATSALTQTDVEIVYKILAELKEQGVAILFISHRMNEIQALCDTLSVFRNGRHIETFAKGEKSELEIVQLMAGREISDKFAGRKKVEITEEPILDVRDLSWENQLKGIDIQVRPGEIVGLGGLDGQGQKELMLALFGVLRGVKGDVRVGDVVGVPKNPHAAKTGGTKIALVPEDRKTEGLMLGRSIADNLINANLAGVSEGPLLSQNLSDKLIAEAIEKLQIKIGSPQDPVSTLSGGNQQKVVLAKWLSIGPDLILLNDPTRGIDIGTKHEIFRLMFELAEAGKAIMFYSSDYSELIACCDRVMVLFDGRVTQQLVGDAITEEGIMSAAFDLEEQAHA